MLRELLNRSALIGLDRGARSIVFISAGFLGTWLLRIALGLDVRSLTGTPIADFLIWIPIGIVLGLGLGELIAAAYIWSRDRRAR